jgi:hypothetical protein
MTRSRDTANILPTVDAKGDLLVGTADSTINNLPAGGDGTYLRANSGSGIGLEWATVDALPTQSGQTGKYLTTDGTLASWASIIPDDDQFIISGQVFG